ncbi:MAG TPA: PH domain-containing protein [Propionibacteriaceae bacterium]|nr:PH domain-containing protein [Propionibacteriaceae bacterium]
MSLVSRFLNPEVERLLLVDEGEVVVDEVPKHWVTIAAPVVALAAVIPLFLSLPAWGRFWEAPLVVGLALVGWSVGVVHREHMDRFVITNLRVLRVHGVFSRHTSTMPVSRIRDIEVHQPVLGRLLGYGHLVLQTTGPERGPRDVRFVAHPEQRDRTIHRVIQAASSTRRGPAEPPWDS